MAASNKIEMTRTEMAMAAQHKKEMAVKGMALAASHDLTEMAIAASANKAGCPSGNRAGCPLKQAMAAVESPHMSGQKMKTAASEKIRSSHHLFSTDMFGTEQFMANLQEREWIGEDNSS